MVLFGKEERVDLARKPKLNTPGPGSYSAWAKSSNIRNQPAYSLGTSKQRPGPVKARDLNLPGPGAYKLIREGCDGGPTRSKSKSIPIGLKNENTSFFSKAVGKRAGKLPGPG